MSKSTIYVSTFLDFEHNSTAAPRRITDLSEIAKLDISVPDGLVIMPAAFLHFVKKNNLSKKIQDLLSTVHFERADSVAQVATHIQNSIVHSNLQDDLEKEIYHKYQKLCRDHKSIALTTDNRMKISTYETLLEELKKTWAAHFDAKHLFFHHTHKSDILKQEIFIVFREIIDFKKTGTINTSDLTINTDATLNAKELGQLKKIGEKMQKHFFIPHIAYWGTAKNTICITRIVPFTNVQRATLLLVRHAESEWNEKGLWTDISLSENGHKQAVEIGKKLKTVHFDIAYTSALLRTIQTLAGIKKGQGQIRLPTVSHKALNETDETVPYFEEKILPQLKAGKNVIVVAHDNTIREMIKHLEGVSYDNVAKLEINTGKMFTYLFDVDGKNIGRDERT